MQCAHTGFFADIDRKTHCVFGVEEWRNTGTLSALYTPLSIKPKSNGRQCSSRPARCSSMSRQDMEQPKHPLNGVGVILGLIIIFLRDFLVQINFQKGVPIINALPDNYRNGLN